MFGIFLDVTQRKQAEEANELLAGEMSHRVKNLLQIATALTRITSRSAATKEDMAHELTDRLMALGRAQDLVRPVPGRKNEATLSWRPHLNSACAVRREGSQRSNSRLGAQDERGRRIEYGVGAWLSMNWQPTRQNTARCRSQAALWTCRAMRNGDEVVVMWTERGGPPVVAPAMLEGFGSKLVHRSMAAQLGGTIAFDWSEEGVVVTLRMSKDRLAN